MITCDKCQSLNCLFCNNSMCTFNDPYIQIIKLKTTTNKLLDRCISSITNSINMRKTKHISRQTVFVGLLLLVVFFVMPSIIYPVSCKEIDAKSDLQQEESVGGNARQRNGRQQAANYLPISYQTRPVDAANDLGTDLNNEPQSVDQLNNGSGDTSISSSSSSASGTEDASPTSVAWPQTRNDLPTIRALNVKCEKNHMTVNIVFDRPFFGMVFSKGHYSDQRCVHLPAASGQTSVNFDIHLGKCGMTSSDANSNDLTLSGTNNSYNNNNNQQQQQQSSGLYIENTIIIQYDAQVQEIWDQARKLRCTWYDYYEKAVTFRPYNVDMHDAVGANFLGDNIQCWMQIQVGKGPYTPEVAGIVRIGQTMTMVLAIKDDENKFDMLVRNCIAHDGKRSPIQLVDQYGCVARPKIMTKFQKVRNFGSSATVLSYAHFNAFKFPDSMSVHFECTIQVCRGQCPEPNCPSLGMQNNALQAGQNNQEPPQIDSSSTVTGDYTAVGSELHAAKEQPPPTHHFNSQLNNNHNSNRVQVRLDTSMLAPTSRLRQPSSALPPQLLHSNLNNQQTATGSILTTRVGSRNSLPAVQHSSFVPQAQAMKVNSRSAAYASIGNVARLGDIAPSNSQNKLQLVSQAAPVVDYHTQTSPHFGPDSNLRPRKKRAVENHLEHLLANLLALSNTQQTSNKNQSRLNNNNGLNFGPKDSTSIKTERTIQVVSPDDISQFNLLETASDQNQPRIVKLPSLDGDLSLSLQQRQLAAKEETFGKSQVCVALRNVILAMIASFSILIMAIVFAVVVYVRQRRNLLLLAGSKFGLNQKSSLPTNGSADLVYAKQQQTNDANSTYIAKLYSQFAPINYWQQQQQQQQQRRPQQQQPQQQQQQQQQQCEIMHPNCVM